MRRRSLAQRPFPDPWVEYLERHVPFYAGLQGEDRDAFHEKLKIFVWEKHWVGGAGMPVTDEMKVVIAATAVRLVLRLGLEYYDRLSEIVVYPDAFKIPDRTGVMLGEARHWGQVVLSYESVLAGLANPHDGQATATHEFAHALDRADGAFDGTPQLRRMGHYAAWAKVMSEHYFRLRQNAPAERTVLRDYGSKNEAEFFAVATESFFEKPRQMREMTPDLYEELSRFFGQDPAAADF